MRLMHQPSRLFGHALGRGCAEVFSVVDVQYTECGAAEPHFMGRALIDARPVHFEDVLTWLDYDARTLEVLQSVARYRSFVAVPIFCEGRAIGVIGCGRREVKPFTTTQIELVKTFAD